MLEDRRRGTTGVDADVDMRLGKLWEFVGDVIVLRFHGSVEKESGMSEQQFG